MSANEKWRGVATPSVDAPVMVLAVSPLSAVVDLLPSTEAPANNKN